ncbi:MAG: alpha/beta hydrolase [Candidatus Eiseniibacteriota bacterium]
MRASLRRSALLAAALATAFALGPRARFDDTPRPLTLPDDLDRHLAESEARFSDIVPGTEKRIVWASPRREATAIAVVYLHGFSATYRDTAPLSEEVAARLGANLYLARLVGHGRGADPLGEADAGDWLRDGREAWEIGRRLGDRVVLMGHSTGAALALWLAARGTGEELLAVILLSPNFAPADPAADILLWPWGGALAELVEGRMREWQPANELQERYFTTRYPTRALLPMMALVHATRSLPLEEVRTPTLVAYCPEDKVVDVCAIERAYERLGGPKRLVPVATADPERHVLAGDILSPGTTEELTREILGFLAVEVGTLPGEPGLRVGVVRPARRP